MIRRSTKLKNLLVVLSVATPLLAIELVLLLVVFPYKPHYAEKPSVQTIFVRNLSPHYISDRTIKNDLPAWQKAIDKVFAPVWNEQAKLVFVGAKQAPTHSIVFTFVDKGAVKGALAYHTVTSGIPSATIYAGTSVYYGYSPSVGFTHELFELLADPVVSIANQGWPDPWVTLDTPSGNKNILALSNPIPTWINEVCDPVEADSQGFTEPGADGKPVIISDFVTPAWFNDQAQATGEGASQPYDVTGTVQGPQEIAVGGYAQYFDGFQWNAVTNFRHAGRDANGFLLGEKLGQQR